MIAVQLFYGDQEPVFVVDTAAYPVRRGRVSSYVEPADKYYRGHPESAGYYRGNSRSRYSDYYGGETRRTDYGAYAVGDRYSNDYYRRSSPGRYYDTDAYSDSYTTPGAYYPAAAPAYAPTHTPYEYDATFYDSRPNEYYEYRKPSTVVLKVPICCESCSEEAKNALFELKGVRSVYCDVRKEMITVTGTAAPADVLQVVRKLHKKSRFWGDDDY
ncbi:hypothetical protein AXG93_638s1090 [Marchantia polymorpha subsp. ruderalis]|uniref:HMA domain-containing protein n=1 Tax=Marchantia polymorpha subsp. ruderalis TaxID=1480154 RepID=A0A176W691_MARPO|nr:hypothetical protein AXG93_638s1090 [Marchantia polymorpha subsp. ruderalis]